jgi:poly-beta-1,6-N-acetyl-D-glucosamine N-deacetylase
MNGFNYKPMPCSLDGAINKRQFLMAGLMLSTGLVQGATAAAKPVKNAVRILCYHDIRDNLRLSFETSPESAAVATNDFVQHFEWLKGNGYKIVSLEQVIQARKGGPDLPANAVMLTFDDGYKSFYTHVFPLLKAYGYPAVIALVEQFMTPDAKGMVVYDEKPLQRDAFISWDEAREMARSGLVEFASHSAYSHKGVLGNAQGSKLPALVTRIYDAKAGVYEADDVYAERVYKDIDSAANMIEREIGSRPRAIVWPYGAYNDTTMKMAQKAGHSVGLNLISNSDNIDTPLMQLGRDLVVFNAGSLINMVKQGSKAQDDEELRQRIIHVDLDYIYDKDTVQQEKNLSLLIERVRNLGASHVYLQAYADPDGNGAATELYFPNRHMPMRADLFQRVAWQLKTRGGVQVYAWMPVMAYELPANHPAAKELVQVHANAPKGHAQTRYPRLSPYSAVARQVLREIYDDLGKHAWGIRGLLLHDDATLDDYEDVSPAAMQAYAQAGLPKNFDSLQQSDKKNRQWAQFKTKSLTDLTLELAGVLRQHIPELETARNIYAPLVLSPEAQTWFAQDLDNMIASYDYTAVMAMPYMEQASKPEEWLKTLAAKVLQHPKAAQRVVFELQSKDWRTNKSINSTKLAEHVMILRRAGIRHIGYYPDNFLEDQPSVKVLKPVFSLTTFPVKS